MKWRPLIIVSHLSDSYKRLYFDVTMSFSRNIREMYGDIFPDH